MHQRLRYVVMYVIIEFSPINQRKLVQQPVIIILLETSQIDVGDRSTTKVHFSTCRHSPLKTVF